MYHASNEKLDKAALKPAERERWAQGSGYTSWQDALDRLKRRDVRVYTFNLPAHTTCPGESAFCAHCYASKGRSGMWQGRYEENLELITRQPGLIYNAVQALPPGSWLRIHASGDFHNAKYISTWTMALDRRPDVQAWAYTRSWRIPRLLPSLEKLRALPNMQLFASTDQTINESPPPGWRTAYIQGDPRASGYACPEQTGSKADCKDCGYCILGYRNDVIFHEH